MAWPCIGEIWIHKNISSKVEKIWVTCIRSPQLFIEKEINVAKEDNGTIATNLFAGA